MKTNFATMEHWLQVSRQTNDFGQIARFAGLAKGHWHEAVRHAERSGAPPRIVSVLKAAVAVGGIATWGSELADFKLVTDSFAQSLQSIGVFDHLLANGLRRTPISSQLGSVSVGVSAYTVSEFGVKPVSSMTLATPASQIAARKSHAVVAITSELLKLGGPAGQALLTRELQTAAALAVDSYFVNSILLSGVSTPTSGGSTSVSARSDIGYLFGQVETDQSSKLFIITTPLICKMWSAMGATATNGAPAFENMGPQGGEICGVPVLASSALAAGLVVMVDANAIAGDAEQFRLDVMREGSIYPDSAPDSPPLSTTNVLNLWQLDQVALVMERWWGAAKLRSTAVAAISNSNSYVSGFSPP
jgi:hypothetical protein